MTSFYDFDIASTKRWDPHVRNNARPQNTQ